MSLHALRMGAKCVLYPFPPHSPVAVSTLARGYFKALRRFNSETPFDFEIASFIRFPVCSAFFSLLRFSPPKIDRATEGKKVPELAMGVRKKELGRPHSSLGRMSFKRFFRPLWKMILQIRLQDEHWGTQKIPIASLFLSRGFIRPNAQIEWLENCLPPSGFNFQMLSTKKKCF